MSRVIVKYNNLIVTCPYSQNHKAVDLICNRGSNAPKGENINILAHSDGEVVEVVKNYNRTDTTGHSYGNYVKIRHDNGYYTLYAHLKYGTVTVNKGDRVSQGQVIGCMGNTGFSKGTHLHFEVRDLGNNRINPTQYVNCDLPSATQNDTQYRVQLVDGTWLPWVTKCDDTNEGYAGIFGKAISCVQVKGKKYQVRIKGGSWLSLIENYNNTNSNGYAGIKGSPIDGLKVHDCQYRVHIKGGNWLEWVSKVDNTNNGYAGLYGKEIDGIQIKELTS